MHTREYLALNPQGYGLLLLTLSLARMVVSTRRTPRKSERGMGKLVEESEGGSTTLVSRKMRILSAVTNMVRW